jgi:hypothetical protein
MRKNYKEYYKRYNRDYYLKNKKRINKRCREYSKEYYLKNKELVDKKHRDYYKITKGKWHKEYAQRNKEKISKRNKKYYYKIKRKRLGIQKYSRRWEKWEDDILYKYYWKVINREIKRRFLKRRSCEAIQNRANKLGLRTYIKFSPKHKRILILRNKKNTNKTYEEIYGEKKAKKLKERFSKRMSGKGNHQYKDGKSKEPYPINWNNALKELIRNRDKKCKICGITRNKSKKLYGCDLIVHHIDRNKKNLNPLNLITLCQFHHFKIQSFQDDLQDHFLAINLGHI